jgi:hypothetical protein
VTNRSRIRQFLDNDGRPRAPGTKPLLVDHPSQLVGDYTNPILKSDAAEIVKKHGELELSGKGYPTPGPSVGLQGCHSFSRTLQCK